MESLIKSGINCVTDLHWSQGFHSQDYLYNYIAGIRCTERRVRACNGKGCIHYFDLYLLITLSALVIEEVQASLLSQSTVHGGTIQHFTVLVPGSLHVLVGDFGSR